MSNRTIEATLRIGAKDATGNVPRNVANKLEQVNKRAAALNRQQGVLARTSAATFAAISRYAAPAAIAYGATRAVKDFAALERQMTRIGVTADATAEQTKKAFEEAQRVTKDLGYDSVQPAIEALDTLTASGKSLEEAMAFLPSVLATAQASGAATEDIANTGIKAASALKIETDQLQRAFDIMVMGGKAGQFELKDMAQYIPGLANSFASLGYQGEDGLKRLVAILQTIREDTGDASSAATQAQNIFGKMFAEDTSNKFKDFGINLRKEMEAAAKAGEDAVSAFVRISKEALNGDLSKLPLLFSDQEFRLGMQSLITSEESLKKFLATVNGAEVDGVVFRDLNRVLGDTQASIDRMSSSWDKMWTSIGAAASRPASATMDAISEDVDYGQAVRNGLYKKGMTYWEAEAWMLKNMPLGSFSRGDGSDRVAFDGGYNDPEFLKKFQFGPNTPEGWRPPSVEFPGGGKGYTNANLPASEAPIPGQRPLTLGPSLTLPGGLPNELQPVGSQPVMAGLPSISVPSQEDWKNALRIDIDSLKNSGQEAGQAVADGGRDAGKAVEESAAFFKVAGVDVAAAIKSAAASLIEAGKSFNRAQASATNLPRGAVNADTGRSMPPSANQPGGGGGGY